MPTLFQTRRKKAELPKPGVAVDEVASKIVAPIGTMFSTVNTLAKTHPSEANIRAVQTLEACQQKLFDVLRPVSSEELDSENEVEEKPAAPDPSWKRGLQG